MKKTLFFLGLFSLNLCFAANPVVTINTNLGEIEVELFQDKAPISAANFLKYVDSKFYDGTIFHRVIGDFMIQGGGYTAKMEEKKNNAPIKSEANNGLKNEAGTLAMARTNEPHSARSQFFINVADNIPLNHTAQNDTGWGYAVFGKVTKGMSVVNRIRQVKTGSLNGLNDVPMDIVLIKSIKRKTKK